MTFPRTARPRHYAMTAPTFFAVEYAINPWMDTTTTVDTHVAMNQWETLRQTYKELGHTVELVEPVAGLPDMVYAANGGLVVGGAAVVARTLRVGEPGDDGRLRRMDDAPRLCAHRNPPRQ